MFTSFDKTITFRSIDHMLEHMPGFEFSLPDPTTVQLFSDPLSEEKLSDVSRAETASLSDGEDGSLVCSSGDSDDDSGLSDGDESSECGDSDELLCDQPGHEHSDCERDTVHLG
mgnify:CR=1 FL=1